MKQQFLKIHDEDHAMVALVNLPKGMEITHQGTSFTLFQQVMAKHKFLVTDRRKGERVLMYGSTIGVANENLKAGQLLTAQNLGHQTDIFGKRQPQQFWEQPDLSPFIEGTFDGYHRSDGQVGTANYWVVIPLVFCENRNVSVMQDAFLEELGFVNPNPYKKLVRNLVKHYQNGQGQWDKVHMEEETHAVSPLFSNVDGIKFLTHQGGCGGTRQDSDMLCALIAGYIHHPNVAGATVLSLGCQNAQIQILEKRINQLNPKFDKPLYIFDQQQEGREDVLLEKAIKKTFEGLINANAYERRPAPLSQLTLGLECGGSDGFSGISANPAVGYVSDLIVALGGKTMLAEFPELCGVEQELINRCVTDSVAEKFLHLMESYSKAALAVGSGFDMNPSPGNIRDGLITDAMKSAGAAKKGGTSPIVDVLDYTEYATKPGLNLLCTPGNDVESTTGLAGSGANIILFTTGLGTPTGNPIAPVIKISSNTALAKRMPDIIDLDAGGVITGDKSISEMGEELFYLIIEVASGRITTKAQQMGQNDFIPWKRGISL